MRTTFNISECATLLDLHRDTVRKYITEHKVKHSDKKGNMKLYKIGPVAKACFTSFNVSPIKKL